MHTERPKGNAQTNLSPVEKGEVGVSTLRRRLQRRRQIAERHSHSISYYIPCIRNINQSIM